MPAFRGDHGFAGLCPPVLRRSTDFGVQYRVRAPTDFSAQEPFEPAVIEDVTFTTLMTEGK
jgi:hypothetical protein